MSANLGIVIFRLARFDRYWQFARHSYGVQFVGLAAGRACWTRCMKHAQMNSTSRSSSFGHAGCDVSRNYRKRWAGLAGASVNDIDLPRTAQTEVTAD
jgi:hypothetical protein